MAETEGGRSGEKDPNSLRLLLRFQTAAEDTVRVLFKAAGTALHLYKTDGDSSVITK